MMILGIDPGVGRTGWGIIGVESSNFKVEKFGCFETLSSSPIEKRLAAIFAFVNKVISEHHPDEIAIEDLFFNTNAKTALIVGQARGVVLLSAAQNSIPLFVYTPLQVKIAVAGYGRAEKQQVGKMIKTLLSLPKVPTPDDTADALAIALTHAFSRKLKNMR